MFSKKEQVSSHPASKAKVEHKGERGREKREGKVQGKKV